MKAQFFNFYIVRNEIALPIVVRWGKTWFRVLIFVFQFTFEW